MNKYLILLLGTAWMSVVELNAQNWVNGGNTLSANGTIGTNSSHSLLFETSGVERGRITNGGNWAVGSTGTTSKFTVNSASAISPFRSQIAAVTKFIVNGNGGVSIGNGTAGPANGLYVAGSVGIGTTAPAQQLHVVGNTYITGSVGIGTATPSYQLHVVTPYTAIYGNSTGSTSYGVWGNSTYLGVFGTGTTYGVLGRGSYGVYGFGKSYGVYGDGPTGVSGTSSSNNGDAVQARATGTGSCWGVNASSQYSYGIYASTGNSSSFAGYFQGRVFSTGGYSSSDLKLKEDIADVSNAMSIINQLQPKSYKFRQDGNYKLMNLPQGQHYGLIAQDVEQVLPNLVAEAEFNTDKVLQSRREEASASGNTVVQQKGEIISFKALNYTELIPILVKGMQEQQQVITQQQQQIDELKVLVYKLTGGQSLNTFLSSAQLGEVSPNPVKGTATIQYAIPEGSTMSKLLITDALGRSLRQISLSTSGVVNVDVTAFASGVYNYSLIVDNKRIATKKMTVIK